MRRLAGGDTAIDVPFRGDKTELGTMADTVEVFRQAAEEKTRLEERQAAAEAEAGAARAGDAGKGFAVVAQEEKSLATQTAKATEDIANQIRTVQDGTNRAVSAIGAINARIDRIREISGSVAAAIEEQNAAASEISRNTQEASNGTQQVSQSIATVTQSNAEVGANANTVLGSAESVTDHADRLSESVGAFLDRIRAA